jgi:hypothetical protein
VAAEGREDIVAAVARYQGRVTALTGVVTKKGVKSVRLFETRSHGRLEGPYVENQGYLTLASDDGKPGEVLCYYPPEQLDALAKVRKGQKVTTRCIFSKYANRRPNPLGVFVGCAIDD